MAMAPFDPRFDPPYQDRHGFVYTVFALLCVTVFFWTVRGCSSTVYAPERRYHVVPDSIPRPYVARSN